MTGDQGIQGDQGDQGIQGDKGIQGIQGDQGPASSFYSVVVNNTNAVSCDSEDYAISAGVTCPSNYYISLSMPTAVAPTLGAGWVATCEKSSGTEDPATIHLLCIDNDPVR